MGKVNAKEDERLWTKITSPEKLCNLYREGGHCALLTRIGNGLYIPYILFCRGKCPEFRERRKECLEG